MEEEVYYERCAGIDVHKKLLVVCMRIGRKTEVRSFGTLTHEIREMIAWLRANGCQMAAMESKSSQCRSLSWSLADVVHSFLYLHPC